MKTKILWLCVNFIFPTIVFGTIWNPQPAYSQVFPERNTAHLYALPYQLNPALTGSNNLESNTIGRLALNYRFQPNDLNSTQIGYDQYVSALKGGLGLMATRDHSSVYGTSHSIISASYARVIPVTDKFYLRTGLQMSIGQKRLDLDKIQTSGPLPSDRVSYPNFAAGIVGYTKQFFVGFAVHNLFEPVQSFYGTEDGIIHRRYTLHGGWELPLSKKENAFVLAPNFIFMRQNNQADVNIGTYLSKGILVSGLWFRQSFGEFKTTDALMVLMGIQTERFRVGYSFDIAVSSTRRISNGAHEITIAYNLFQNKEEGGALARRVPYPAF
jgi:type IX secretion system PorP/SprF family membrane protein